MRRKGRRPAGSDILPGYSDITEIGGGAFATVFRAVEVDTGRLVALKTLKVDTVHPHLMETFHQEIQALGKVSDHPNIVTLYRPLTTADGRPVLVLELCRESLAQQVRRSGPLDAIDVSRIGIKIAGALETAHRNGFLHRDMKPQNVLVTQFGEPALADFGVAALQASAQATAGVFGFTTLHAAPEILEGQKLSPAADVYGLASTMYQLLTGTAPFAAFDNEAPASVILRILRDPVRPLSSDKVPIGLSDLIEAALAKDPERRPPTAAVLAEALAEVQASCGWPVTPCAILERDGPPPATWPVGTPGGGDAAPTPLAPLGGPGVVLPLQPAVTLYPSGPSVRVVADPPERPVATSAPWVTPPPPPPPAPAARSVVAPGDVRRGVPNRPIAPPAGREPLESPEPAIRSPGPVFVDPSDDGGSLRGAGSAPSPARHTPNVYEETALPPGRPGRSGQPEERARATPAFEHPLLSHPYVFAGVGAATLVVIAAVLLIVGVI
ncbi:MAG: protein kinase domain-containing protein [Acidimicrobiales bacterium]